MKSSEIHTAVRERYAKIATTGSTCCGSSCGPTSEPAEDAERVELPRVDKIEGVPMLLFVRRPTST